ncbi:MAG: immunoglobulin domain-containing protein, partial [Methylococcales bacterium]|nr:immunoglobulin domain-containing protein [Methylococcales bacterium]
MKISEDGSMEVSVRAIGSVVEGQPAALALALTDLYPVHDATVAANFIGGLTVNFFDNGLAPDLISGDGIYTGMIVIPAGVDTADLHVLAVAPGKDDLDTVVTYIIPKPPVNDDFENRLVLDNNTGKTTGTNVRATTEDSELLPPMPSGGKTVWYEWRASNNNKVHFTINSTAFRTCLAIYKGGPNLDELELNGYDYSDYAYNSVLELTPVAGRSYYIQVDGIDDESGPFAMYHPYDGAPVGGPVFTTYPAPQTLTLGDTLVLDPVADGDDPMTYQWFLDGTAISGATTTNFTKNNVTSADQGTYTVTATNAIGEATSPDTFILIERVAF